MQQVETIQLVPNFSIIFNKLVRFFSRPGDATTPPAPFKININWHDSVSEQSCYGSDNQHVSGGYNEAFIVQQWASFHLR
jgi:hypothetical protein